MYTRVQYHRDGKNEERTIGTRGGKTRTRAQSGVKSRLCAAAVENKNKESTTPWGHRVLGGGGLMGVRTAHMLASGIYIDTCISTTLLLLFSAAAAIYAEHTPYGRYSARGYISLVCLCMYVYIRMDARTNAATRRCCSWRRFLIDCRGRLA